MHYGTLLSNYSLLCCCLYVLLSEQLCSVLHHLSTPSKKGSLRKQLSICNVTTDLLVQWQVWNEQRKSKLVTCHYTNTFSAFDGLKQISIVVICQCSEFCIFCSLLICYTAVFSVVTQRSSPLVCYKAVFSVVTQRSSPTNGC